MSRASVKFDKSACGRYTLCTVGIHPRIGVVGAGTTPASALHTAASIAADLSDVLKEHPALASVLPPGTALALRGMSEASKALAKGVDPADVAKAVGPATARIVGKLLSIF